MALAGQPRNHENGAAAKAIFTPVSRRILLQLRRPGVARVIAGATSPEQARNNAAAAGWKLTDGSLPRSILSRQVQSERLLVNYRCDEISSKYGLL
jgi:aryl-alcohol dehydrogenase-like predicted oxidoreductase